MSLGEVCRALEINEATLRQWADRGRLPVYRTPGGHRRFLREDVDALLSRIQATETDPEDLALEQIRRKLSQADVSEQSWMESFPGGRAGSDAPVRAAAAVAAPPERP